MPAGTRTKDELCRSRAEIPQNVVYRRFVAETVLLNLNTGKYHGINPSGGYLLELLEKLGSVEQVAATLAREYGLPLERAVDDLCDLCVELEQRDLLVLSSSG